MNMRKTAALLSVCGLLVFALAILFVYVAAVMWLLIFRFPEVLITALSTAFYLLGVTGAYHP